MSVCKPGCVITVPKNDWANGCDISTRKGGIPRLTFLKCDPNMVLPYEGGWLNLDNIRWAICNDYLYITGPLMGQKPKGTKNKKRLSSCDPEQVVSGTQTISVLDYNADPEDLIDFDFWTAIDKNQKFLKLGWITCEDLWFQYDGTWSGDINFVQEDTNDGNAYWDNTFDMATKDVIKPIVVPGLKALIDSYSSADCYS